MKYSLKGEPQTVVPLAAPECHAALNYLEGQFISLAAACAFVLEDPITECTRNVTPTTFPSWKIDAKTACQGRWKRYVLRLPYREDALVRAGYTGKVFPHDLILSVLFSTCSTFLRYFGDAREEGLGSVQGATKKQAVLRGKTQRSWTQPQKLSRHTWDGRPDDPCHPDYNKTLSELLPGNRLVSSRGSGKTDVFQKLRNSKLQFTRFWEYDLSTKVDAHGVLCGLYFFLPVHLFVQIDISYRCRILNRSPL